MSENKRDFEFIIYTEGMLDYFSLPCFAVLLGTEMILRRRTRTRQSERQTATDTDCKRSADFGALFDFTHASFLFSQALYMKMPSEIV